MIPALYPNLQDGFMRLPHCISRYNAGSWFPRTVSLDTTRVHRFSALYLEIQHRVMISPHSISGYNAVHRFSALYLRILASMPLLPHCISRCNAASRSSSVVSSDTRSIVLFLEFLRKKNQACYNGADRNMAQRIKALLAFMKLLPGSLRDFARRIYAGMNGNPVYPNPPVSMEALAAQIETYSSWIVEAMDGSRKAIAERDRQGAELIKMLRELAGYVEYIAEDMASFLSSGYQPSPNTRTQTPPLSESIRKIIFGDNSGELKVKVVAVLDAHSYELRWAARIADGTPGEWTTQPFGNTKRFLSITGLTPGTVYLFQVRALIDKVFTDWSDPVTKMCK